MLAVLVFKTICHSLENRKGMQARLGAEHGTPLCIRHERCSNYYHGWNFYNAHIHVMWLICHITFQDHSTVGCFCRWTGRQYKVSQTIGQFDPTTGHPHCGQSQPIQWRVSH